MTITIDAAGRLVIPKAIRDSAGLRPGIDLHIEYRDGKVQIEPAQGRAKWIKRGSFVVAEAPPGTATLTNEDVQSILDQVRGSRA